MVQRQDDKVFVDNVKRMAEFSRIPYSGHLFHVRSMLVQKAHQLRRRLVSEAEDNPVVNLVLCRVSSDSPKNWEALFSQPINRSQIALFKIRPDPFSGGR